MSAGATAAVPFAQALVPAVGVTVGAATAHYTDKGLDYAYEKYAREWLVNVGVSGLNKGRDIFETVGRGVDSVSDVK